MPYSLPKYGPNINPSEVRRRIWRNENENSLKGPPRATMYEEDVVLIVVDGKPVERSFGNQMTPLVHSPANPNEPVELRNISDDTLLGMTTIGVIHTMIYSLGRHMQKLRDWSMLRSIDGEEIQDALGVATDALGAAVAASEVAAAEATRLEGIAAGIPSGPDHDAADAIAGAARAEATRLAGEIPAKSAEVARLTTQFQDLIAATGG